MNPEETAQAIADLKAARAELVARGRCQGSLVKEDGQVCARGAIGVALNPDFETKYLSEEKTPIGTDAWTYTFITQRWYNVHHAIRRHLPDGTWIEQFNDAPTTTDQDVLDLFDKTLAELGGLA